MQGVIVLKMACALYLEARDLGSDFDCLHKPCIALGNSHNLLGLSFLIFLKLSLMAPHYRWKLSRDSTSEIPDCNLEGLGESSYPPRCACGFLKLDHPLPALKR
jgi:hypothetical protein